GTARRRERSGQAPERRAATASAAEERVSTRSPSTSTTVSKSSVRSPCRRRSACPASDWREAKRKVPRGSRSATKRTAPLQRLQTPSKRITGWGGGAGGMGSARWFLEIREGGRHLAAPPWPAASSRRPLHGSSTVPPAVAVP